jgi:hypothetical protein
MPRRASVPSYDDLMRVRVEHRRELHPTTQAIINLTQGERLDCTPDDGDLAAERSRLVSRIRTASMETGNDYAQRTLDGRLYVVCLIRGTERH